jgi:hypothetical protein
MKKKKEKKTLRSSPVAMVLVLLYTTVLLYYCTTIVRTKREKPQLPVAHGRTRGPIRWERGVLHNISKNTRKKGGKPNFRLHMRDPRESLQCHVILGHFRSFDFRSGPLPVTSSHVTSGRPPHGSTANTTWKPLIYYYCGGCGFKKDKRKNYNKDYNELFHLPLCSSLLLTVISNQMYNFFREALIKGDGNRTIEINVKLNCLSIIKGNSVHMVVLEIVQQKFNT